MEIGRGDHLEWVDVGGTPGEYHELEGEVATMVRSIRENFPLPIQPDEARRAVALCLAVTRSMESGDVIPLDASCL